MSITHLTEFKLARVWLKLPKHGHTWVDTEVQPIFYNVWSNSEIKAHGATSSRQSNHIAEPKTCTHSHKVGNQHNIYCTIYGPNKAKELFIVVTNQLKSTQCPHRIFELKRKGSLAQMSKRPSFTSQEVLRCQMWRFIMAAPICRTRLTVMIKLSNSLLQPLSSGHERARQVHWASAGFGVWPDWSELSDLYVGTEMILDCVQCDLFLMIKEHFANEQKCHTGSDKNNIYKKHLKNLCDTFWVVMQIKYFIQTTVAIGSQIQGSMLLQLWECLVRAWVIVSLFKRHNNNWCFLKP